VNASKRVSSQRASRLELSRHVPGRSRWEVRGLFGNPAWALALDQALSRQGWLTNIIINPRSGRILLEYPCSRSLSEVQRVLFEVVLQTELTAGGEEQQERSLARKDAARQLWRRASSRSSLLVGVIGTALLGRLIESTHPLFLGLAIDTLAGRPSRLVARLGGASLRGQMLAVAGGAFSTWLLTSALEYCHTLFAARLAKSIQSELRLEVHDKIQSLGISFTEARSSGELLHLLDADLNRVSEFLEEGIDPVVGIGASVLVSALTFSSLSPLLGLLQLGVLPFLVGGSAALLRPLRRRNEMANEAEANLLSVLNENLAGQTSIQSMTAEAHELGRVGRLGQRQAELALSAAQMRALYIPLFRVIVGAGFALTLMTGSHQVERRRLSIGNFNALAHASIRLLTSLARFSRVVQDIDRALAAYRRLTKLLAKQPLVPDGELPLTPAAVRGRVRFERVHFAYPNGRQVFEGLSLDLAAGKAIGIVGSTGSGKTSVIRLLLRFYAQQSGRILLDEVDISQIRQKELRQQIALVPQQVYLFAGSVEENIRYGTWEATRQSVEQAARAASADDFIRALPRGYETQLSEGGRNLSGGERQRLAIARAFLTQRPILVFDEATSSVDNETEAAIQRSLAERCRGRTTIIIAHRIATVRSADLILVLEEGRVVEKGTHDALIDQGGSYANLWRLQTGASLLDTTSGAERA
jgi:ATP-binding cassette, subfamily B, bacterial